MSSRSARWVIHESKDGSFELSRGGRSMYSNASSRAEILRRLKMHHKPGEPVFSEEVDGYRTNITAQLKKAGVIS